jgi:ribonuclease P protein component
MRAGRKEGLGSPSNRGSGLKTDSAGERRISRAAQVLRKSGDFERVLRSGYRTATENFVLRGVRNDESYARLGIIAGRKSAPRAVDRNRAKRLIRETFRHFAGQLETHDVAIQLRGNLRSHVNRAVREELHSLSEAYVRRLTKSAEK